MAASLPGDVKRLRVHVEAAEVFKALDLLVIVVLVILGHQEVAELEVRVLELLESPALSDEDLIVGEEPLEVLFGLLGALQHQVLLVELCADVRGLQVAGAQLFEGLRELVELERGLVRDLVLHVLGIDCH